jgi:hypothetical protein
MAACARDSQAGPIASPRKGGLCNAPDYFAGCGLRVRFFWEVAAKEPIARQPLELHLAAQILNPFEKAN